ncbi:MAG: ATP-binding cassette domain-containing protein, partial [Eubacteriales bacterium]|nr:ATP-binding cassette domain-containing protein [Eubacteriales bacterium]
SLKDNLDMFSNLDFETVISTIKDNGLEFLLGINKSDDIYEKLKSELDKDTLSSGQKQLINLIRLFFSEKDLIIFDEAAASISEDVEEEYFEVLDKLSKKNILIIVTHNVERLEKCDKILMLNNGSVQEYGLRSVLEKDPNSYYYKYSRKNEIKINK